MLIYVDDIIIIDSIILWINLIKYFIDKLFISQLGSGFFLNNLGYLHYSLEVETIHDENELFLAQYRYILDLFERTFMKHYKPIFTPLSTSYKIRNLLLLHCLLLFHIKILLVLTYLTTTTRSLIYAV